MMDSITREHYERQAQGWHSLAEEFRAMAARIRAERERLLGPDRGE